MLIALCFTSDFDFAGQTSTHTPQPVQSSGATWIVIAIPDTSLDRKALDLNPSGAPASSVGSYTFIRIVACGHTAAHRPQSMQMSGSKIGISCAMERFSYFAVPVGKTPSTGSAETGSRSPSPARSSAVTRFTNSGALSGIRCSRRTVAVTLSGISTWCRAASDASMAAKFRSTIVLPRAAYVFSSAALMWPIACSVGRTPDSAKKHGCMTVFTRLPISASRATRCASITHMSMCLAMSSLWTSIGRWSQTSSGPHELFSRKVAPAARARAP